ncbi:DEAD/DEAH box helicase [Protaetiibacter intestinalis]|uniref:DEAD/DEAH box helicase n=1 Tax=Protaetiibacter intestinalis TaxID=2419774 RepID=A0A387B254_9MICO|nr:DEAD/DEAH box helicase [Protaetiibacter intestinalis]AYF97594.1 DEAD/DEAH box helicase [Protaetiibacter intestinalis]
MTTDFRTLGVPAPLVAALAADGKTEAFPIQADTLPDTLAGRDVLGRGRTGSGKTIAFALPLVARLGTKLAGGGRRGGLPLGLVLAPTRELATQIATTIAPLAEAYGLRVTTIYGGVSQNRQVEALRAGVDIVVACPGRLEDLMGQKLVRLDAIEITVIDEADHMADLGFLPGVTRILAATPEGGQRLLFSATLDNGVDKLVTRFLDQPVLHSVDEAHSPVAAMTHHVFSVEGVEAKKELVQALASGTSRRILFMRTKHHAKRLAQQLTASGIPAVDLHGNLSQPQRDRNLAAFSDGSVRVLVATDVAARGVHVDDVELVVHVDPPMEHKAYLHRSGRTARAGSAGDVVTVVMPGQEKDLAQLMRKAAITATPERVTATSDAVTALVGEVAEYVKPAPKEPRQQQGGGGRSQGANAQRKRAARAEREAAQPRADRPRRDRSGRPAAKQQRAAGSASGQTRSGGGRSATTRGGSATVYSSSSSAPQGNPRRGGRRAARPAG